MAYTLRYYKTLPQPGDRDIVLEIYEKDGVRSSMEIGPVIQALHLDIQGSQEDIDTPVVKTSLVMTFVDAQDHEEASSKKCGNWEEFYTSDSTYWKVVLKNRTASGSFSPIWGGYVTPDSFTEQLRYRGSVTIVARDNIGHMQDFPFDSKGNEDGMITVYDLVNTAWAKIESPMSLNWRGEEDEAMWLQCDGHDVTGAYLNVSAFKGMNWYEAMEKVLYSIGAVMRYVGDNTVQVSSLRYMPYQGSASMSSLAEIEPKFIAHANRELVPAVRRIEESVKYEVEVMTAIPVEPDDYTGSIESFLIEGNSVDYDGVAWPISQKNSGYGWCNPEKSLFFNPAAYSFWKDRDEDSSFMFIAANNYEISTIYDRYAEYSRYMNAQNAVFRMTVGAPYKITDDGELMNMGYLYEAMTALIVVKAISNGLTSYLQTNGEWGVGKAKIEVPISNGKIELPIDFGDYDGAVLLAVQIHQILTTKSDAAYQHSALYLPVYEVTIGANTPVLERNAINTLYNNDNNVIISRNPEIGPAYNVVAFPRQIKNGMFIKSGDVYLPAKAWAWSGGTPQQMAVYNHLQILCYHAKPNNVITGDIVNADLGNLRALYMWHGSEHLLQGGSLNFLNGRIEGAILREFARYDDMWGDVTGDSMPATEQESSTNVEEGGSSSGSSATYENTTNVTIGGSGGGSVTVDTFLSDTSTNPVQNRAIKAYVDTKIAPFEDMFYFADDNTIGTKYSFFSEQENSAGGAGEAIGTSGGGGDVDLTGYATEEWVQSQGYAKTSDIPTKVSALENDAEYVTRSQADGTYVIWTDEFVPLKNKVDSIDERVTVLEATGGTGSGDIDLTAYATKTWVEEQVGGKQDTIEDLAVIREGASKGATAAQPADIPTKVSQLTNDRNYITTTAADGKYAAYSDLAAYLKSTDIADWAKAANKPSYDYSEINNTPDLSIYALASALNDYALKNDVYTQQQIAEILKSYVLTNDITELVEWYENIGVKFIKDDDGAIKMDGDFYTTGENSAGGVGENVGTSGGGGLDESQLEDYLTENGYATQSWVTLQGYASSSSVDAKQDKITDLATIRAGAALGATALQGVPDGYVTETELDQKGYATTTDLSGKVDKVTGKGLSTNDYTTEDKNKLASLENYDDTEVKNGITANAEAIADVSNRVIPLEEWYDLVGQHFKYDETNEAWYLDGDFYATGENSAGGAGDELIDIAGLDTRVETLETKVEELQKTSGQNLAIDFQGLDDLIQLSGSITPAELAAVGLTAAAIENMLNGQYNKIVHSGAKRQVWNYTAYEGDGVISIYLMQGDGFDIFNGYHLSYSSTTGYWSIVFGEI